MPPPCQTNLAVSVFFPSNIGPKFQCRLSYSHKARLRGGDEIGSKELCFIYLLDSSQMINLVAKS